MLPARPQIAGSIANVAAMHPNRGPGSSEYWKIVTGSSFSSRSRVLCAFFQTRHKVEQGGCCMRKVTANRL